MLNIESVHLRFDNPFHLPLFLANKDEDINDLNVVFFFTYFAEFHKWS